MTPKNIVITGASKGIGAALAKQLAERGDHLMLAARDYQTLKSTARWCGRNAVAFTTDMTRRADVNRLRDEAIRSFDHVDVWINNAGRGINRPVLDLTDDDFDEMMTVNVKSALYGMQAIIPHFKERGAGQLINVSSFLGRVPSASQRSAYNAAKHALNSLTANLRMDLRKEFPSIKVTLVMPGLTSTEFAANAMYGSPLPESVKTSPNTQTPEQVAAAIVGVIDQPCAEIFTQPAQAERARRYYQDVEAYEAGL
jgi:short-subunit dehydrogenase